MNLGTFGPYTLEKKLGSGGMAEVFLARYDAPEGFSKQLVVKRMHAGLADEEHFVRMFLDEARLSARLSHPNVVQVFDFGQADGAYFLAMEYIEGATLRDLWQACQREKSVFPAAVVVSIGMALCDALHHVHTAVDADGSPLRIVHRDVSPQNVMITRRGEVKLLDLGIAKADGLTEQTQVGVLKGKFAYMSPEQVRHQSLDGRSDVFSVGILLHELLTGERLFRREVDLQTLRAVEEHPIPDLRGVRPDAPDRLSQAVAWALERDPAQRAPSAQALGDTLEEIYETLGAGRSRSVIRSFVAHQLGWQLEATTGERPSPLLPEEDGERLTATGYKTGRHKAAPPREKMSPALMLLLALGVFVAPALGWWASRASGPSDPAPAPAEVAAEAAAPAKRPPSRRPKSPAREARGATTAQAPASSPRPEAAADPQSAPAPAPPAPGPDGVAPLRLGTLLVQCAQPCDVASQGTFLARQITEASLPLPMGEHELTFTDSVSGQITRERLIIAPQRVRLYEFRPAKPAASPIPRGLDELSGTEDW